MKCPRCGKPLYVTLEADYGHCVVHGDIFIGEPLTAPWKPAVKYKPPTGYEHRQSNRGIR